MTEETIATQLGKASVFIRQFVVQANTSKIAGSNTRNQAQHRKQSL